MKLSVETMAILSNFASINQNIHIEPGNYIKTKSPASSVIAIAKVPEEFPRAFSIYELSKLLNVFSLFEDPEIEFYDGHLDVSYKRAKASFAYTNTALVDAIKDYSKNIKEADPSATFTIDDATFKRIQKSAKLFGIEDININSNGDNIVVNASDAPLSKANANRYSIDIEPTTTDYSNFSVNIKLDSLRFLPGDYEVSIAIVNVKNRSIAICKFHNKSLSEADVTYIVSGDVD